MLGGGVEPPRPEGQEGLSLPRLPIPASQRSATGRDRTATAVRRRIYSPVGSPTMPSRYREGRDGIEPSRPFRARSLSRRVPSPAFGLTFQIEAGLLLSSSCPSSGRRRLSTATRCTSGCPSKGTALLQCDRRESNPHAHRTPRPQRGPSTSSGTVAKCCGWVTNSTRSYYSVVKEPDPDPLAGAPERKLRALNVETPSGLVGPEGVSVNLGLCRGLHADHLRAALIQGRPPACKLGARQ